MYAIRSISLAILTLVWTGTALAADPAEVARLLPGGGNTLSIVRVQDLLKSSRGKAENWAGDYETQFLAGANVVPPWVDLIVRNSHVIPTTGQRTSLAVLVESTRPIDLAKLAAHENSTVTDVSGYAAISSPGQSGYLVKLRDQTVGLISPASRQEVRKWLATFPATRKLPATAVTPQTPVPVSPYLRSLFDSPAQVVVGIDLEDAFEAQAVCTWLGVCKAVDKKSPEMAILEKVAPKLQGARLELRVDTETEATITLDFLENIGAAAKTVKAVFIEALSEHGALLPEFETAQAEVRADAVILRTKLSDASLRQLMGLLLSATPATTTLESLEASTAGTTTTEPVKPTPAPSTTRSQSDPLERNRRYYRAIAQVVDDLRTRDRKATNYTRTAVFHESAAERIEKLSLVGIDQDLADYGARTAANLRSLAASMRGQAIKIQAGNASVVYNAQVTPGGTAWQPGWGWGWGGFHYQQPAINVTSNLTEVREKQAQAVAAGAGEREQIWQLLDGDRAEMRRVLLERYKVDFDLDPRKKTP